MGALMGEGAAELSRGTGIKGGLLFALANIREPNYHSRGDVMSTVCPRVLLQFIEFEYTSNFTIGIYRGFFHCDADTVSLWSEQMFLRVSLIIRENKDRR